MLGVPQTRRITARLTTGAIVLLIAVGQVAFPVPVAAAPSDITTYAGGLGAGAATTVRQVPLGLGISGTKAYVVDAANAAVRVIDLGTGNETVIAGNGAPGFAGDGGPATSAQLRFDASASWPSGVAVDSGGNVYVSDTLNHRIRMVMPSGTISTVAGTGAESFGGDGGPATQAYLDKPAGLALDSSGNLFVADDWNNRIRKITPTGTITTVAGGGTSGLGDGGAATSAGLSHPFGVYVDGAGNLYIAEGPGYGRIRKVTAATGIITTVAGGGTAYPGDGGPATSATLFYPSGVTFDSTGNMYIAESSDIRKVTTDGIIHTFAGAFAWLGFSGDGGPASAARLNSPTAVVFDGAGNLLIDDTGNARIRRVDTAGNISTYAGNGNCGSAGDGGAATSAQLCAPSGLAVDTTGNLYVADTGNGRVRKVTPAGVITTFAGGGNTNPGDGGPATAAYLNQPSGIAFDSGGNLYIAETGNNRVRKVTAAGVITTIAGNGSTPGFSGDGGAATSAQLNTPNAVAVDGGGNVFIADSANNRIREVTAAGIISTFAGGGTAVPGDGGPATAASLANPSGVAVDATGTVYLSDTDRGSVQKVTLDGTINTVISNGNTCCVWNFSGLAVTSSGYLLSAVPRQQHVYITGSSGALTVVAGTGTAGYAGDGGPATAAQLWSPTAVAVDAAGNRYIADAGNNRVRRVQAASPPGAPTNVKASPGAGFAFVSWTAPPDGGSPIGSYTITPVANGTARTPTTIRGTPPLTSVTVTGLDKTTYTFTVTAANDGGTGPASAVSNAVTPYGSAANDCGLPIAVAAGLDHRLVLKSNGTVWGWGNNFDGELGTGDTNSSVTPVPSQMTGAIAIAAGSAHSLALKSDGTVWGWGDNSFGQLGTGSTSAPSYAPVTIPGQVVNLSSVIAIAAGGRYSLALKSDATVWAWGNNASGQLGNGTSTSSAVPVQVSGLFGIIAIAGGSAHALALKSDGTVWAWGNNVYGQLGQPPLSGPLGGSGLRAARPTEDPSRASIDTLTRAPQQRRAALLSTAVAPAANYSALPLQVPNLGGNVTAVAGGFWHSLALKSDGSVWAWGDNFYGELGTNVGQYSFVPPQPAAISGIVSIAGGRGTSVAARADGSVWVWGYNWPTAPTQVGGIGTVTMVADGNRQLLALDANSQVWEWGLRSIATPIRVTGVPNGVSLLASGDFHSLLLANGQVWAWGWNGDGQLGNGSMTGSASPVQTIGLPSIAGPIAAGSYHSLAVDNTRSNAWAWGDNGSGQLGLGTGNYTSTDTAKPGGFNPSTIAAGGFHSLETDNTNSTLAYGSNLYGELGQPTSTTRNATPTAVPNFPNVRSVAAGRYHSLAAMDGGRVFAWGDNLDGELGNGSFTSSSTPVEVSGLPFQQPAPAQTVAAGAFTSFALEFGNVYAWGYNGDGELGIGTTTDSSTAVQIPNFSPNRIAPGAFHVLTTKADGTVWAWGDNSAGQLGNGTAAASYTPTQVPSLTNVVAIAAGGNQSLALKQDGSLWQWGAVYTASPVLVAGLINPSLPVVSALTPTNGSVGGGTAVTITGHGLSGATGVSFGGVAATSFTVNSDSQITATAPPGKPGPVDVTVSTSACASAAAAVSRFTYGNLYGVASNHQYVLKNSNGTDWADMDSKSLALLIRPAGNSNVLLSANADLFTGTAGYNQDIGIFVSDNGGADQLLAWKESGGFAGTFSPNAAYVQYLFNMVSGHTYRFKLKWKTNINAAGATIYAGAGSGPYSLTSLVAETFPTGVAPSFAVSTSQYLLPNPDGASWQPIDAVNLSTILTPTANGTAVLGGNADLWTANAGYNQDLGIFVSDNGAPDMLVGWKESGGFAGTYSPNAAFVKATYAMTAGHVYTFKLEWKTNRYAAGATIVAAAGGGPVYSQTSLLAATIAAGANPYSAVSTSQYSLPNSDGATWQPIDAALSVPVTPSVDTNSIIGANVDLWTASPGVNQDIGIFVSDNGGADVLLAWKESGGFAGTFSPNAAFAQAVYPMTAGHAYVFKLKWKTNKDAPAATIYAAAGGSAPYSQTRLTVELTN